MNVLVTGGNGFLGYTIVCQLLKRGYQVRSLSRSPSAKLEKLGVPTLQVNLSNPKALIQALDRVDAIFHVAAQAGIWGPYRHYFENNVLGTRNLLEAAQHARTPYFIYTSTASVVFDRRDFHNDNETLPYGKNWLCAYAQTKALAEREVLSASRDLSIKSIALRPHLIWGPGDPHLFPRLIQQAKDKKLVQIGPGDNWVDLTHVDNVAHAHILALEALKKNTGIGKAYFISQNEPIALWPWIKGFLKAIGLSPKLKKLPTTLAYPLSAGIEIMHKLLPSLGEPRLTRFVVHELTHDHCFSSALAQKDLDYKPILSFAEGMQERIDYWRAYLSR